jgi:hypothetical protein
MGAMAMSVNVNGSAVTPVGDFGLFAGGSNGAA